MHQIQQQAIPLAPTINPAQSVPAQAAPIAMKPMKAKQDAPAYFASLKHDTRNAVIIVLSVLVVMTGVSYVLNMLLNAITDPALQASIIL